MINLETLFKNHFDTKAISDDKLQKFSEDHLSRLSAFDNPGTFVPILGQTSDAHIAYFGSIANEDVVTAIRQGMTVRVDNAMAGFKKLVQRKEGAIRSAFGEDGAEYKEFFPHGLTEYTAASKENIELLMDRIVTASQNNAPDIEAGLSTAFSVARDAYVGPRRLQLGKKGEVSNKKTKSTETRAALELQLTKNLHFIGYEFAGDTQKCMSFFDQSFLREHNTGGSGDNGSDGTPK